MRAYDAALQVLIRFIAASSLLSGGCIIPYAYPHLSWVPGVEAARRDEEVHAFRVDVNGDILDLGETDDYLLTPLALSPKGRAPAQARLALDYGYYVMGIALNYPVHHGHSTLLRLYQPGYRLVEVCAWEMPGKVKWQPAPDLKAQEKAVDGLLRPPSLVGPRTARWNVHGLRPGSATPGNRQALLFAASEYERLTGLLGPNEKDGRAQKDRLLQKAHELRERAAE